jgi:Glyoxalase-like domain
VGDVVRTDRLVQAIVLVVDLEAARGALQSLGLTVLEGGRHPGRGTANLIVPFSGAAQYLELLAVVDEAEALSSPQGRPVAAALSRRGPGLARWSVEPLDIEATAARVGLPVEDRRRVLPDGTTVRWRCVGVDAAWDEPWRCAFMAWADPDLHPARMGGGGIVHENGATALARLDVDVPHGQALPDWLGGPVPDGVEVSVSGGSGPTGLFLASPNGPIPLPIL